MSIRVINGDCLEVMPSMEANSVDAIVTDPPAGISFMGKTWDGDKGGRDQWIAWMQTVAAECLRVIKPGGHALVWALPRTSHWTATAWENAGFTVRDRISHLFSTGFPKSLDVSKQIDKAAGAEREVVGLSENSRTAQKQGGRAFDAALGGEPLGGIHITVPATDAARQWQGWGTALKPAAEDFWLLRKPFPKGYTVAQNVLEFGTGGLNIDACRVDGAPRNPGFVNPGESHRDMMATSNKKLVGYVSPEGRWPANVIHDGSDEVLAAFPQARSSGAYESADAGNSGEGVNFGTVGGINRSTTMYSDTGSAARFFHNTREGESRVFYTAKASSFDRNDGTYDLPAQFSPTMGNGIGGKEHDPKTATRRGNHHPTVKPTELMRWLCRLITPPSGLILDPFCGSGSTLKAAEIEGFSAIGIELDPAYVEIARRRIESDIPLFAETARKGYALTEEALSNSASETLWCSQHCVPERISQFDLFAEIAA